jgi:predicted nucleic acid-binding protein
MPVSSFLDTNILIYAIEADGENQEKSQVAWNLTRQHDICISTQVLGEFYSATTSSRRKSPLTHHEAVAWVQLWKRLEIRLITLAEVDLALELVEKYRIAYYDALILATASLAGCSWVESEDLNSGQDYAGIHVRNPFQAA